MGCYLLITVYIVGIIGFNIPAWVDWFRLLTPLNLLFSLVVMLAFHKHWSIPFLFYLVVIYCLGFAVEWAGVHTGEIFGVYEYKDALGPKLFDIPLIIGVNWVLLIYTTGTIAGYWKVHFLLQSVLGALLMTGIDLLIEPFAIKYGLWEWEAIAVPLQNYLAWFGISFFMLIPMLRYRWNESNKMAPVLYVLQLIFFSVLYFC